MDRARASRELQETRQRERCGVEDGRLKLGWGEGSRRQGKKWEASRVPAFAESFLGATCMDREPGSHCSLNSSRCGLRLFASAGYCEVKLEKNRGWPTRHVEAILRGGIN